MKRSTFRMRATLIFAIHFSLQCAAWALADSPGGPQLPWRILSFPLFYALNSWATLYFWMVGVLNSAFWALALGFATSPLLRRRETH